MKIDQSYDYIIAGGGLAGLSLAYRMSQSKLKSKRILIIDKTQKNQNDRTWCFWEKKDTIFEEIVFKKWSLLNFLSPKHSSLLKFSPFHYKMIRGIDFYNFTQLALLQNPNIEYLFGEIKIIQNHDQKAVVAVVVPGEINERVVSADWVFNSVYNPSIIHGQKGVHYLLQHFKGWEIETKNEFFNPEEATLMDFRIEQKGECRFFYVLPTSSTNALVEFTVFSKNLLENHEYDLELNKYFQEYLQLDQYKISHEEFGVIPMTDGFFEKTDGRIINIGTNGGVVKPSSGYAFYRIQQHTEALVEAILKTGKPILKENKFNQFAFFDAIFLNVMAKNRYSSAHIFASLFKNNHTATVLRFLNEETSVLENLKIICSVYPLPFWRALIDVLKHRKVPFR